MIEEEVRMAMGLELGHAPRDEGSGDQARP